MPAPRPPQRLLVYAVLLVYSLSATSCASGWKMQTKPVREVVEPQPVPGKTEVPKPPAQVRVRWDGKGPTVIDRPYVRNDSLCGTVRGMKVFTHEDLPFSAPLDSIKRVEVYRSRPVADLAIGIGVTILLLAGLLALACTTDSADCASGSWSWP